MTYATEKAKVGKELFEIVEVDFDFCVHSFDVKACNPYNHIGAYERSDFSTWSYAPPHAVVTTDTDIAPNGLQDADTIRDDSNSLLAPFVNYFSNNFDATKSYYGSVYIKKDSDTSRFPVFYLFFDGSSNEIIQMILNTSTGSYAASILLGSPTISSYNVIDAGDYWFIYLGGYTSDAANTIAAFYIYPAYTATYADPPVSDGTVTGEVVAWRGMITEGIPLEYGVGKQCYNTRSTCLSSEDYLSIDYDTAFPGNLITGSEDLSDAAWTVVGTSVVTTNTDVAPDGTTTADTLNDDDNTAHEYIYQSKTLNPNSYYTASVFIKKDTTSSRTVLLRLLFDGSTGQNADLHFRTDTGEYSISLSASALSIVESVIDIGDYWFLSINSKTTDSANTTVTVQLYTAAGTTLTSYSVAAIGQTVFWRAELRETTRTDVYTRFFKTYKFCTKSRAPIGQGFLPCLDKNSVKQSPVLAEPAEISKRGNITVNLNDFSHHDRGFDPYVSTRTYDPSTQGTFLGRMVARNEFVFGRTLRYRHGYYTEPFDIANFKTWTYIIESMSGLNSNSQVQIRAKDRLRLADDNKRLVPSPSNGTLSAGINSAVTSLSVNTGEGAEYLLSGTIAIGDEDMTYTRSGDTFTVVRGVNGTTASSHDAGDSVQECKVYTTTNVVDIVHDILVNHCGVLETQIPYDAGLAVPTGYNDEWDDEKTNWFGLNSLTRTIRTPTGANQLLSELCQQNNMTLFVDLVNDKIKLKSGTPPLANVTIDTLNDDQHFLRNTVKTKDRDDLRYNEVVIFYNKKDNSANDEAKNYGTIAIFSNLIKSSADENLVPKVLKIKANWLTSSALVTQLGTRLLQRFDLSPREIEFKVDAKDNDYEIGDIVYVDTIRIQGADGANKKTSFELTQARHDGDDMLYRGISSTYNDENGLNAFIGPNTLNDYSSESAPNKLAYAFICLDSGLFANGDPGYKII